VRSRRAIWPNRSKVTSCSTSDVAGRSGRAACIRPAAPRSRRRRAPGDGLLHGGRAELVDLRRQQRGPARLAVAGLGDQHHARAEFEDGAPAAGIVIGEGEQLDVEFARDLAQQVEECAPRRRARAERGNRARARRRGGAPASRPAFEHAIAPGALRMLALRPGPPPGAQIDAVERHAAPEEERRQARRRWWRSRREL
jgi:hypothetical protein